MGKPKIRFKGFDNDWEQRKFSELYSKVSEKNDLSFGTEKIISVANMYFKEDVKDSSEEYMRTYNIMRLGDIAFEGNKSKNYAHGRFVENTIGDGIVSHVFDVFRPIVDYDLFFWKYFINNESVMGRIMTRCTKASTMMTNLVASDFLKEEILVPSIDEQKEIGKYLDTLDHFITLHQRKCEDTKKLKKYMLQKMFPQNGSKVPEIRFKGFTDDWEQRKFGSLLDETKNKTSVEDEDTLLSCAINGMYLNSELFSHFRGASNVGYLKVKKNDLILSAQNLHLGNCNVNLRFEHGIISPAYKVYELVDCNPLFMQAWVKRDSTKNFFLRASTEGASICRKNIVWEELYKQELLVPDIEEQKKIGAYLDYLDHLITLHQNKCDELKKIKKYMLQNMFV